MSDFDLTSVKKISYMVPVSEELLMSYGLIPDTRPPRVFTRRQRFRWWRQDKISGLRVRLASWVAGFDVADHE